MYDELMLHLVIGKVTIVTYVAYTIISVIQAQWMESRHSLLEMFNTALTMHSWYADKS